MLTFALLLLSPGQDGFNPVGDPDRTIGDSRLTRESEQNPFPRPPLAQIGEKVIRFSTMPALRWGAGNIVTITPGEKGEAIASIDTVRRQCNAVTQSRCRLVTERSLNFAFCDENVCGYDAIAGRIRGLLFDPARMPRKGDELCTDGPGYLTELREQGRTYNLSGFCSGQHPNNLIYRIIRAGVGKHWKQIGGEE